MGSPYYMSPEQLRSTRNVDHRADVWSLGVVLFELLTGTTIFDETKEFTELGADILEAPHRSLRSFRPDAPEGLEEIVDRCLEKDRSRRYQNVAELAVALLPYAPRRARVSAERTASITKAAGLMTDPNFHMPPSDFPPPNVNTRDSAPLGFGVLPPLPAFTPPTGMPVTPPPPGSRPDMSTPSLPGSVETLAPAAPRRRPPLVAMLAGAAALFGLGSLLAYGLVRSLRPPVFVDVTSSSTSLAAPPARPHASVALPAVSETAAATPGSASAAAATPTPAKPGITIGRPGVVRPVVRPSASATTKTSSPTLDIQLQR